MTGPPEKDLSKGKICAPLLMKDSANPSFLIEFYNQVFERSGLQSSPLKARMRDRRHERGRILNGEGQDSVGPHVQNTVDLLQTAANLKE